MNYKQEIAKTQKEKLAGFCYDLAKLVFGAMVVGDLTPYLLGAAESVNWMILLIGSFVTSLLAWCGYEILKV